MKYIISNDKQYLETINNSILKQMEEDVTNFSATSYAPILENKSKNNFCLPVDTNDSRLDMSVLEGISMVDTLPVEFKPEVKPI